MKKKTKTVSKKAKAVLYPWMEEDLKFVRNMGGAESGQPDLIERTERFVKEYEQQGWCSAECWNLDHRFAVWIVPRLRHFAKYSGIPGSMKKEEWNKILNDMLEGFELMSSDRYWMLNKNENEKVDLALKLFGEYARALWI